MKILLINPPAHRRVEESDLATWQHLGIGKLSSFLKQFGHEVTIIDAKLQRLDIPKVINIIENKMPDMVGLTAMTPDIYNAYTIARGIKNLDRRMITVVGGCHATVMPERTMQEENSLDYIVFGEGERTLKELVDAVNSGASPELFSKVKGIVFRNGSKIVKTETRPWDTTLGELPITDWQLHSYAKNYQIETTRGCPFRCNYCMRVLGGMVRYFPIENVLREFEHIMQFKDNMTVEIVDETFTLNHKRIYELLDGMIAINVGKKIRWFCSTRADTLNKELLEKMKKAGCFKVCFGAESGNSDVLRRMNKKIKLEETTRVVQMTKEAGLESFLSFILGHPNETLDEMVDTINFIVDTNPHTVALGTMVPYPGTEIAQIVKRMEGNYRLLSNDWTEYGRQFSYVLELEDISKRDMDKLQMIGTLKLFLYNRRFKDLMVFISQYWWESIQFFKMILSRRTQKGKDISPSKISFLKLMQILFSDPKKKSARKNTTVPL